MRALDARQDHCGYAQQNRKANRPVERMDAVACAWLSQHARNCGLRGWRVGRAWPRQSGEIALLAKWCIRQVGCDFSESGALHGAPVRAGEVAMTLRVRALSEEEAHRLARMTRSQKLGAGLVRRAQIIQHAVDGLSAPGIAAKMGLCGATV